MRRALLAALIATACSAMSCGARAAPAALDYPNRPVTLVVPYTPGTGIDVIARMLAQHFTTAWKQAVIVDNKPGASSNIGTESVARSAPDGYTLLVSATTFATNPALNTHIAYDPVKSFTPVILVATGSMGLVVSNATPAHSVAEFVSLAKSHPGELNYGSSGNGTPLHLAMELFKLEADIDVTHIPYKGTAGAVNDLVGGRLNAMLMPVHTALSYITQRQMRALAVIAPKRLAVLPDVPTMAEAGYPAVQVSVWYALFAPSGTPPEVISKLNRDIDAMLQLPDPRATLARQGLIAHGGAPEQLAELVAAELKRWPRVVSAAHIRAD